MTLRPLWIFWIHALITACSTSPNKSTNQEANEALSPPPLSFSQPILVAFDENGKTAPFQIPKSAPEKTLTLRAEAQDHSPMCFTLSGLKDSEQTYITKAEQGAYCISCQQRVSVITGQGIWVLPTQLEGLEMTGPLTVELQRMDCVTLTPKKSAGTTVKLSWHEKAPSSGGDIFLEFLVSKHSSLYTNTPQIKEVAAELNQLLEELNLRVGGLTITLVPESATTGDSNFSRSEQSALTQITRYRQTSAPTIPIVLAGCLELSDPLTQTTMELDGFTPRIPGGYTEADGVFIKGRECFISSSSIKWTSQDLARLISHELGHYLGLYHSIETEGVEDPFDDSSNANAMHFDPFLSTSKGFSPGQKSILSRHPFIQSN